MYVTNWGPSDRRTHVISKRKGRARLDGATLLQPLRSSYRDAWQWRYLASQSHLDVLVLDGRQNILFQPNPAFHNMLKSILLSGLQNSAGACSQHFIDRCSALYKRCTRMDFAKFNISSKKMWCRIRFKVWEWGFAFDEVTPEEERVLSGRKSSKST